MTFRARTASRMHHGSCPGKRRRSPARIPGALGYTGVTFKDHPGCRQRQSDQRHAAGPGPVRGRQRGDRARQHHLLDLLDVRPPDRRADVADGVLHRQARDRPHRRPAHLRAVPDRPEVLLRPRREALRDHDPRGAVHAGGRILQRSVERADRRLQGLRADDQLQRLDVLRAQRDRRRRTVGRRFGQHDAEPTRLSVHRESTSRCSARTSTASTSRRTSSRLSGRSSTARRSTRSARARSSAAR